jgi:hypothetical protein
VRVEEIDEAPSFSRGEYMRFAMSPTPLEEIGAVLLMPLKRKSQLK